MLFFNIFRTQEWKRWRKGAILPTQNGRTFLAFF
jgi:hypothetical protein